MPKRIAVGISGASGVIYGVRLLQVLKETDYETHLIISKSGELNIKIETDDDPNDATERPLPECRVGRSLNHGFKVGAAWLL